MPLDSSRCDQLCLKPLRSHFLDKKNVKVAMLSNFVFNMGISGLRNFGSFHKTALSNKNPVVVAQQGLKEVKVRKPKQFFG